MAYKLRYYGVIDIALDLMKSYLTNTKQYVVFDSCQSEHTGVLQASILVASPLLFSVVSLKG